MWSFAFFNSTYESPTALCLRYEMVVIVALMEEIRGNTYQADFYDINSTQT